MVALAQPEILGKHRGIWLHDHELLTLATIRHGNTYFKTEMEDLREGAVVYLKIDDAGERMAHELFLRDNVRDRYFVVPL